MTVNEMVSDGGTDYTNYRTGDAYEYVDYGSYRPDATNTGHTGTPTVWPGDYITTRDGEVVADLHIQGQIKIRHNDVLVTNCLVTGETAPMSGPGNYVLVEAYSSAWPTGIEIYRCTLAPANPRPQHTACGQGRNITFRECDISGATDGLRCQNSNITILGNYIHDLSYFTDDPNQGPEGSHTDDFQWAGGGSDIVLRGNSFEADDHGTSCVILLQDLGAGSNMVVDKNWMISHSTVQADATGAGLNIAEKGLGAFGGVVRITDNQFSPPEDWSSNHCGLIDSCTYDAAVISGNVEVGTAIPAKITRIRKDPCNFTP